MNSMTGFGKSEQIADGRKIRVEIKSVNNRFLDINIRQPRFMICFEELIRSCIKNNIQRGRVDVFIYFSSDRNDSKIISVDASLVEGYIKAAKQISEQTGAKNDLTVSQILKLPDVVSIEDNESDETDLKQLLLSAIEEAVNELKTARKTEGEQLEADIFKRLELLSDINNDIKQYENTVVEEYRNKLKERLEVVLDSNMIDEQRLAQELAIYADRVNITEELVRIDSHISGFKSLAKEDGAQGRNMDFIVQELNREFNTIGSKAQNNFILKDVLAAKGEIEKIREQIQNVE